jgi:hypothetical protein
VVSGGRSELAVKGQVGNETNQPKQDLSDQSRRQSNHNRDEGDEDDATIYGSRVPRRQYRLECRPMDGAIGKPSVDDGPAILWSVTVDPVGRPDLGFVGGGPAVISVSDSRFSHAIAQGNKPEEVLVTIPQEPPTWPGKSAKNYTTEKVTDRSSRLRAVD